MAQWYCYINGQQYGPVGDEEFRQWVAAGRVKAEDLVWREGMGDWASAGQVPGLFAAAGIYAGVAAPPIGPSPGQPGMHSQPGPVVTPGSVYVPPPTLGPGGGYPAGAGGFPTTARLRGTCGRCGSAVRPDMPFCARCGAPVIDPAPKSKLVAGLLGIFFGGLGFHRFYLGYITIGVIQIAVTAMTCGAAGLWGLIEGILILAGQIKTDAEGWPLKD